MPEPTVWTFFYGSFINLDVLRAVDIVPRHHEVASLSGFDIRIEPLANLARCEAHGVYGIVAAVTHRELDRLYRYARDELGGEYLPEAVMVRTPDGKFMPALCYIAAHMVAAQATNDYIDRIVQPARTYGFPESYIARLERFRPDAPA